ncbi:MAG: hypothetical protein EKK51_00225 [Mycolicibacterium sp.]|uniref:hypothetical protein n=1 Tax=Mycolicibacterium sp. TaxID=2320850 RepID=UPI000FBD435E|nr:hypothetical protein [Mycolicibacterium sp.]RUP35019.1 MAG: hypothetical protein EKK51_00225 [Mycolicibacterium sp.]
MTTPDPTADSKPDSLANEVGDTTEDVHQSDTPDTTDTTESPNKEAAKWRTKLRDTEAERDGLATRLETMQRAEAERLAAQHLANGADLWLTGTTLTDMLDDNGNLDPAKITTAATTLGADRPHWRCTASSAAPAGEVTARGKIDGGPNRTWADVLRGE